MKCLNQIDAQQVGSICIDSNTYLSIYDVFKMNNLIQDIRNVLFEKKAFDIKILLRYNFDCKHKI